MFTSKNLETSDVFLHPLPKHQTGEKPQGESSREMRERKNKRTRFRQKFKFLLRCFWRRD